MTTSQTSGPKYTLASNDASYRKSSRSSKPDHPAGDDNISLTYSATSSVQSGGSAAGESTDSSFADIMRVLEHDERKTTSTPTSSGKRNKSGTSVASSLAYSTDGESHLDGSQLLQTIAGQPSDSYAFDGSSGTEGTDDIMFAPAAPAAVRKKKKHATTPTTSSSPCPSVDTPTKAPPATPPPLPYKKRTSGGLELTSEDDEDIWYAKWWMSCFPDAFKNLMPKR